MQVQRVQPDEDWLTLRQAAELLGVHQNTLRRWADAGQISVYRTPGGHRRFRRDAIATFQRQSAANGAAAHTSLQGNGAKSPATTAGRSGTSLSHLLNQTLADTRGALQSPSMQRQLANGSLDQATVAARRESGRRLLGILLQLAAHPSASDELFERGRQIAREYGREAHRLGLQSSEIVRLWLAFRHIIVDSLAASHPKGADEASAYPLMHRISHFFDALLVESLEAFEEGLSATVRPSHIEATDCPSRPAYALSVGEGTPQNADEEHREA